MLQIVADQKLGVALGSQPTLSRWENTPSARDLLLCNERRYVKGFFDYAIADEVHELKGDTAQGNALGTLASCAGRILGKTAPSLVFTQAA
jgi:hypothetical protein